MKRLLARSILLAGGVTLSTHSLALGLGEMTLDSALNQPLNASVDLIDVQGLTNAEIKPRLASAEDFERAGIDRYQFLTQMKFSVNGDRILITTRDPVNEPFLNFLVELNWPAGRVLREYTVLLDPPVFEEGRVQPLVTVPAGTVQSTATVVEKIDATPQTMPKQSNPWQTPATPGTYKVQPDDTLWEIALATRPNRSVSPQQMMIALQDTNPDAFIGGNINRLKTHMILDIPDASVIETINNRSAVAEVVRQNREINAGVPQIDATGRTTDEPDPVSGAPIGEVRLLASQADGKAKQSGGSVSGVAGTQGEAKTDLAIALENLDKSQRENQELVDRLNALEEQLAKMERLITLQNDQLASMQAEAVNRAADPEQSAEQLETSTLSQDHAKTSKVEIDSVSGEAAVASSNVDEQPAVPQSSDSITPVATSEIVGAEKTSSENVEGNTSMSEVIDAGSSANTETDYNYSGSEDVTPTALNSTAATEKTAAPVVDSAESRDVASQSNRSIIDKVLAIPYEYLAIALGVLLPLIVLLLRLRARKEEEAVSAAEQELSAVENVADGAELDEFDQLDDLSDADDLPAFNESTSVSDSNDMTEDSDGDATNLITDSADDDLDVYDDADGEHDKVGQSEDALSESDIYIAYGKFAQASELLAGAITAEPKRIDLRLKQLEVLSALDDAQAFANAESELIAIGDANASAQAAELRMQLSNSIEPEAQVVDNVTLEDELTVLDDSLESEFDDGLDFETALDLGDVDGLEINGAGEDSGNITELTESSEADSAEITLDAPFDTDELNLDDDSLNPIAGNIDDLSSADTEPALEFVASPVMNDEFDDVSPDESADLEIDEELLSGLDKLSDEGASDDVDLEPALEFSTDSLELDEVPEVASEQTDTVSSAISEVDDHLSIDFELDDLATSSADSEDLLPGLEQDTEVPQVSEELEDESRVEESGSQTAAQAIDDVPDLDLDVALDVDNELRDSEDIDLPDFESDTKDEQDNGLTAEQTKEDSTVVVSDDISELSEDIELEDLTTTGGDESSDSEGLIGGIDLDELVAADDEFDFLAGTDECATKLDLAQAYIDMEDVDGAKELLQEVIQEGSDAQKQEAKNLMDKLS